MGYVLRMNTRVTGSILGGIVLFRKIRNSSIMFAISLLISNRRSVILLKGKSFNYPLSAQDIFLKMDLWTKG